MKHLVVSPIFESKKMPKCHKMRNRNEKKRKMYLWYLPWNCVRASSINSTVLSIFGEVEVEHIDLIVKSFVGWNGRRRRRRKSRREQSRWLSWLKKINELEHCGLFSFVDQIEKIFFIKKKKKTEWEWNHKCLRFIITYSMKGATFFFLLQPLVSTEFNLPTIEHNKMTM